ncbi:MAG: polyprenyl synthetase family protein [Syntrophomonadaceae bacterium]
MNLDMALFELELINRKRYIDRSLEQYLGGEMPRPALIHEAMRYAVMNGGKRLRPILVLEAARIAGAEPDQVTPSACALEFIHCYSLVHDDLPAMDDDDFRRGKPTCHKVFGEANAILTGDALLTAAFDLLAANSEIEGIELQDVVQVIREVASAAGSRGMIGGQVLDLAGDTHLAPDGLSELHRLKTGELFKAALRAGAILGKMEGQDLEALTRFAYNFGLAFQITDDILDVSGDQAVLGKPVGSDDKNARTTYISLYGLAGAREKARLSVADCLEDLSRFGPEADFLRDLARFTLVRTY